MAQEIGRSEEAKWSGWGGSSKSVPGGSYLECMARQTNHTDLALSTQLAERNIDATPRKLETMRQAGMLEESRRQGLGRGPGSRSIRPPDEVDRAEYMIRLLDEVGNYAEAVLVAFVRGEHPIAKDRLEQAYERSFGVFVRWIAVRAGRGASLADATLQAGSTIGRYLAKQKHFAGFRGRVRFLGLVHEHAPMARVMQDLGTDLVRLMVIGERDDRLLSEAATNFEHLATAASFETDPEPKPEPTDLPLAELARRLDIPGILRLVRSATMEDLELARDQALTFRTLAQAFAPTMERRYGPGPAFPWKLIASARDQVIAYSAPAFVLLRRIRGARLDDTIRFMADWIPFFQAANLVVDQLPPDLQVVAREGGLESLTSAQREELRVRLDRISKSHPTEFALVENPPEIRKIVG